MGISNPFRSIGNLFGGGRSGGTGGTNPGDPEIDSRTNTPTNSESQNTASNPLWQMGTAIGLGLYSDYRARKEADKNRNFQLSASNTSHQREVADLRAAGLNPLLSANAGASQPAGATASNSEMASTALDAQRVNLEMQGLKSTVALQTAQAAGAQAAALRDATTARSITLDNRLKTKQLPGQLKHADIDNDMATVDNWIRRGGEATSAAANLIPKFRIQGPEKPKPDPLKKPDWRTPNLFQN